MGKYNLRTVLIIFFVVQVAGTTVAVTYLALRHGQTAVNTIVTSLLSEILSRVEDRLDTLVGDAPQANAANRAAIQTDLLSWGDDERWLAHFWQQKDQFPTIGYLTVTDDQGEWLGLRTHGGLRIEATDGAKGLNTYAVSKTGGRAQQLKHIDGYDATARDWYRLPREQRRPVWSPIYIWLGTNVLSMTLSEPLFDRQGAFIGIVAADLALGEMHAYLRKIQVGKTGRVFLLERDGNLIAASAEASPFTQTPEGPRRMHVTEYADATVARAGANLEQHFGTLAPIAKLQQLQFGQGKETEHVLVSPFNDPFGLDWLLVVVVPEADFMGGIYEGTRKTVMICMGILALTLVFGVIYSGQISKPIRALSEQVQQVQQFKLDNPFDVRSSVSEVGSLADALARMQAGLSSFRRFVPADLVRRILELGEEASLGGEVRTVTILFSDLQGYSTLFEKLTPETVIAFMNLYFESMERVISEHQGVVLELHGDAILAVFGAPDDLLDHATAATRCAIAMRARLEVMNTHLQQTAYADIGGFDGTLDLQHRIGIHTGQVVAGNIGGQSYMKYGVIGEVVNIAARLEQLNKQHGTSLLVSSEVYQELPRNLQARAKDRGNSNLKGREQPQRVYSI